MTNLGTLALAALAASAAHAVVTPNNTACSLQSNTCLPTALCKATGNAAKPCQVKDNVDNYPQQVHLAFAGEVAGTGMTISWSTYAEVPDSAVWVGQTKDTLKLVNTPVTHISYYHDNTYNMFHHHATVNGLTPHTKYFYKVGSKGNPVYTSTICSFTTARAAEDTSPTKVVLYGDFGVGKESQDTLAYVNKLNPDSLDFIFHLGDMGYADDAIIMTGLGDGFYYEYLYNSFMNSLTPAMCSIPYMVYVGNHETEDHSSQFFSSLQTQNMLRNFTAYNARFRMPSMESNGISNMWYSFKHGPVQFILLSSETDYVGEPSNEFADPPRNGHFGNQLAWARKSLEKAHANRVKVPWIIVGMHRPLYELAGCPNGVPAGQNAYIQAAFEELFLEFKVDVVLTAHQHNYQRNTPIRKNNPVMDGVSSDLKTYTNAQAPAYIVCGTGGSVESLDPKPDPNSAKWNAASNFVDYGILTLEATRSTLSWKFLKSSNGAVLDEFVMKKTV